MENQQPVMTHVQKGLIISAVLIVISIGLYVGGLNTQTWAQWIGNIIFFAGIVWACIYYGKQKDNYVTFGNLFAHGFKVTAVVTVIMLVFTVIFVLVFPDIKEKSMEIARQRMEERGNLTDDQIETGLNMTQKFFMVFLIGGILFGYAIFGAIASLIGAAVTKKNKTNPLDQLSI